MARIRALFVQGCLEQAVAEGPKVIAAVESRLGPQRLERARDRMRLAWLDVEDLWDVGRGVRDASDHRGEKAFWKATLRTQLDSGLLAPIRTAAFAIFGRTPLALARWTPKAWVQLFPDGPMMDFVDGEEGHAVMRLTGWQWDDEMLDIFRTALHGVFNGFFELTEQTGTVGSVLLDNGAQFELDWG